MKLLRTTVALLLALTTVSLVGCRKKDRESDVPQGTRVGLVLPDAGSPFYQAVRQWADGMAKEKGYELVIQDGKGKASEQARAIEQLLQQDVSVILLSPLDIAQLRPAIQKATEKKVYLVMLEETDPDADVSTVVEFNQELAGQLAADYFGARLKSGGKVAVIGSETAPGEPQRLTAFKEYLRRKHPSIELVAEEANTTAAGQRAAIDSLLKSHSDLDALFALTDEIGMAAVEAIRGRGGKKPFVVTYGGRPVVVEELQKPDSPLAMLVGVFPQKLGERVGRLAYRIVSNKPTPSHIYLEVLPVTRDNYGSYPAWDQPPPADLQVPWTTDLKIEPKRDE